MADLADRNWRHLALLLRSTRRVVVVQLFGRRAADGLALDRFSKAGDKSTEAIRRYRAAKRRVVVDRSSLARIQRSRQKATAVAQLAARVLWPLTLPISHP